MELYTKTLTVDVRHLPSVEAFNKFVEDNKERIVGQTRRQENDYSSRYIFILEKE